MKPSEMNDQELIEAWFVEAHGMEPILTEEFNFQVHFTGSVRYFERLPNILDSESAFNEWVLPVMEGVGCWLEVYRESISWEEKVKGGYDSCKIEVDVENNRRLRAAVEGALEIWRERHDK